MKNKIFMYLFLFTVLLVVFQYANSKSILDKYEKDINKYKAKNIELNTKISELEAKNEELNNFTIEHNEPAIDYFEDQNIDTGILLPKLRDELLEMNFYKGDDHPIVPYASMTDSKIIINAIKIVNHKWLLANFTDGKHWGEIFVNYSVDKNGKLSYKLTDYFLYPVN